jgi:ABC-type dipeptide/oligopeptide/nickel transport system ATPase subunit
MAKITNYIPEPTPEYDSNNQQQVLQSLETMKNQLNFTYQEEIKNEQNTFNYFMQ